MKHPATNSEARATCTSKSWAQNKGQKAETKLDQSELYLPEQRPAVHTGYSFQYMGLQFTLGHTDAPIYFFLNVLGN